MITPILSIEEAAAKAVAEAIAAAASGLADDGAFFGAVVRLLGPNRRFVTDDAPELLRNLAIACECSDRLVEVVRRLPDQNVILGLRALREAALRRVRL